MSETSGQSSPEVVKLIDKGMGKRIYIRVSQFHDHDYLDIRNFYQAENEEWKPTRKGIAIPVELYDELIDALKDIKPLIASCLARKA